MEKIVGANKKLIQNAIDFARKFMKLPENIDLYFEECPSERFLNENIAAEGEKDRIVFNKKWFYKSKNGHQDDIEYYVFHELRHTYQLNEIELMINGKQIHEGVSVVEAWRKGFDNYIPNIDERTKILNVNQEVEQDAYGYGLALLNFYYFDNKEAKLNLSMPKEAQKIANERSLKYYTQLPEFQKYIEKLRKRNQ